MSIYKRVSGIRPSPLQNLHLQPSEPPPSATKEQLVLFDRVLGRRTAQLKDLPLASLSTVYLLLSESKNPTAEEIRVLLKELPNKDPTTEHQYVSIILYLLIGNFHKSIDTREQRDCRQVSLKKVHHILQCCDIAYTDHTEDTKEEILQEQKLAEEKKKREVKESEKKAAEEAKKKSEILRNLYHHQKDISIPKVPEKPQHQKETDSSTKAAKEETIAMGLVFSSQKASIEGKVGHEAIEILDSDDEAESPSEAQTQPAIVSKHFTSSQNQTATKSPTALLNGTHNSSQSKDGTAEGPVISKPKEAAISEKEHKEHLASAASKINSTISVSSKKLDRFPLLLNHLRLPTSRRSITFHPDVKIGAGLLSSSQLEQRSPRHFTFYQGHSPNPDHCSFIDGEILNDVHDRYSKWDPYWEVSHDLSLHSIQGIRVGYKTSTIVDPQKNIDCPPLSAVAINFQIGDLATRLKSGSFKKQAREQRLMLRALPLVVPEKYKKARSDTPLWPKGTFIQHNGIPLNILQRKQQSHDHSLWKGMSDMLDLTGLAMRVPGRQTKQRLEICTKDPDGYNFQLVICTFVPPQVLFERCIGDGPNSLTKLSIEEGRALVKQNLDEKDAVVIDDSDGEDDTGLDTSNIYLTYSLLCGASMSAIKTPVRGKNCKHMQCFDLANYLHSNINISGGRWRCLVCEDFVPVQDLMIDGFVAKILNEHGNDVSSSRDKVEIYRNGSWKFLSDNRLKYQKKRPNSSSEQPEGKRANTQGSGGQAEVIDILDN